jgi:hypothetical protein
MGIMLSWIGAGVKRKIRQFLSRCLKLIMDIMFSWINAGVKRKIRQFLSICLQLIIGVIIPWVSAGVKRKIPKNREKLGAGRCLPWFGLL